jgi:general secretion pathway protein J
MASGRGFTLLEILVAIFILAIVVSLVLSAFNGIFSNADRINISSDLSEMGNACLDRMAADLTSVHVLFYPRYKPPDLMEEKPELYRVVGEVRDLGGQTFSWLRFASAAHLPINHDSREGIAQIVYYVQETDDGAFIIRRADHLYPYPEFKENDTDPVLCEQVRGFKLTYFDGKDREFEKWDSQSEDTEYSTPRAIGIRLAIGDEASPYIFSTRIRLPAYRYKPIKR